MLNPYLVSVQNRTATKAEWKSAPKWVRTQETNVLRPPAEPAFMLACVAKYRRIDPPMARLFMHNLKHGFNT